MTRSGTTAHRLAWTSNAQATLVRWARLGALVPALALALTVSAVGSHDVVGVASLVGLVLLLLGTVVACTESFSRCSVSAMTAVPLLDIAAIWAFHLVPGAEVVAALVAVPAMWLGGVLRARGVILVSLVCVGLFTLPGLVSDGTPYGGWTHAAAIIVLAGVASAAMAAVAELWQAQLGRAEQQGAQLAVALEAVEEHRQYIETLVRTVDVGLAALGPDGRYVSMNPRHQEFLDLGFPEGHRGIAGQIGNATAADNKTLLVREKLPSARAANGETFTDQVMWVGPRPVGRRALSASARPMLDEHGGFVGAVLAYHDITDLVRALSVKDDFVASVSHELRTPLTSIMGYLDLAIERKDELPADVGHFLAVASRNADRLLLLVSDLLNAAQGDGATMLLFPEQTDLSAVVQLSLDDVAQSADAAGLTVHAEVEPMLALMVDRGRIEQVVENLLSNAVKYTRPGGTITLTLTREASTVVLVVRDTGIGIGAEDQPSLFTKFFRASSATAGAIPGIGLGLVISKAIIDAHGGNITVESQEGVGTSVQVTLPFVSAEPIAADEPCLATNQPPY